jgi:hypothetical protein
MIRLEYLGGGGLFVLVVDPPNASNSSNMLFLFVEEDDVLVIKEENGSILELDVDGINGVSSYMNTMNYFWQCKSKDGIYRLNVG